MTNLILPIPNQSRFFVALFMVTLLGCFFTPVLGQDFLKDSTLIGVSLDQTTSMRFGPDGRLYVSQQDGLIKAFFIERTASRIYKATKTEQITLIKNMANHNDNGALNTGLGKRQVTGILIEGTPDKPVLYVSSSDSRIGGPSSGDTNLDTNSGMISRLTWIHNQPPSETDFINLKDEALWEKVDIVRGLPRSEENHATNGMRSATIGGKKYIFLSVGGMTNAGSPSQSFNKITEYALAGAVLSIDLAALEAMPVYIDKRTNSKVIYDIPTVDDPTRENINNTHLDFPYPSDHPLFNTTIDLGDPFGGNDGLNQGKVVPGGPVQLFATGFRNTYDLEITSDRRMYVSDNGANTGWGGYPENEGTPNVTNNYWSIDEPGTNKQHPFDGEYVNNQDHLELITGVGVGTIDTYTPGSFYGGHPNPIRANPAGAGLYTHFGANDDSNGAFRTSKDDPEFPLPADWPPVPVELAHPIEGDFQLPGVNDNAITTWQHNTNGIAEYTASNLGGKYKGNLFAGSSSKGISVYRLELNPDGTKKSLNQEFITNLKGEFILSIECQGDNEQFPGTIWLATYNKGIRIVEPTDYDGNQGPVCTGADDPTLDEDGDGFDNADEIDNGYDPCNAVNSPPDNDGDKTSDLNDPDDDNDGIEDHLDVFQVDNKIVSIPSENELLNEIGYGFYGIGLTGIMTNLDPNDDYLNWLYVENPDNPEEDDVYGGTAGKINVKMTAGDALGSLNTQEKAFQFGLSVDKNFPFTIRSVTEKPFHNFTGEESQGAFIGTGDQDNYIKIVMNAGGIAVVKEDNGVATPLVQQALTGTPALNVTLFFSINPLNTTVQPRYAIDYKETQGAVNTIINLGDPIPFTGKLLEIIQKADKPLAVGIIGTSKGSAESFQANYDKFAATYDPVTAEGEWYAIEGTVPTKRHENAFVQVGDHFYVLGGRGNKKIEKYNLTTKTWSATNTFLNDIHHFQAVTYDGLIYIINGMTGGFPAETPLTNVLIYDPINDKLVTGPEIPVARRRGSSGVVVYQDKIYVIAGIQNGHTDGWVKWVDEFDPVTGTWTPLTDALRERDHFMAAVQGGKIYVAGGRRSFYDGKNFDFSQTIAEVDVYDIETDKWTNLPNGIPTQRAGAPVGILGGELFVMGGESAQKEAHPQTEALNLTTNTWRSAKNMLTPRHATQAIVNNGGIFLAAGSSKQGAADMDSQTAFFLSGQKDPSGTPIPNSTLAPSVANVDFDTVEVGQTVTESVTLTNSGTGLGILIESITLTGDPAFTLQNVPTGLPKLLPPGSEFSLDIVLNQTSEAGKNATLTIQHTGSGSPLTIPIVVGDGGTVEPSVPVVLINAGGPKYTDTEGNGWIADKNFVTGNPFSTTNPIEGTEDDKIYQSERYTSANGQFGYEIPVAAGVYDVYLHFAEIFFTETTDIGKRVFNVSIEGKEALNNYDIIADVGPATAVVKKISAILVNDGNLSIVFSNVQDNAKVNAIAVYTNTGEQGIAIDSIAAQDSKVGDEPSLTVIAKGGVGNLTFKATGLPDGLSIEPTNGMIMGTVAGSALAGSPYNVTVSVVDENKNSASTQFVWTVTSLVAGDADNDGIADTTDAFAFDPANGANTTFPVHIDFKNSSSIFANGFNGMMLDPAGNNDFRNMHNPAEVIVEGENGNLVINNIPGGDAYLQTNTQKNAFQFGMKVPAEKFIVHTRLLQPFINVEPIKFRSMGMYIGNGDQDNYIKLVIGGTPNKEAQVQILKEVEGEVGDADVKTVVNDSIKTAAFIDLFLEIDTANNTATPSYYINGIPVESSFEPVTIPEAWLSNVLAFGIISTSNGGSMDVANPFTAKWDVFDVKAPLVVIDSTTDAECAGNFGTATLEISGGIEPYTVNWGEGVNPDELTGGTYQVEVSDTSGYKSFIEIEITQPEEIILALTQTAAPTCTTNGSVNWEVSGTTDYTAEWTDAGNNPIEGANPMSLPAGTYYLEVTDNITGCATNSSIILTPIDTLAPVLNNLPVDTLIACGSEIPASPEVTATDDCDDTVEVIFTEEEVEVGKITRTWTATDTAGNTASFTQVIECPTGIEDEIDNNKLIVYPNPSPDKIVNFEINLNKGKATMLVYDMVGKLLMEKEVPTGTVNTLNFSGYGSGSYMIKVYNEDEIIIKRFIIE